MFSNCSTSNGRINVNAPVYSAVLRAQSRTIVSYSRPMSNISGRTPKLNYYLKAKSFATMMGLCLYEVYADHGQIQHESVVFVSECPSLLR